MPHIIPDADSPQADTQGDIHRTVAQAYVNWLNPAARRNTLVGEQDPRSGSLIAPTSPLEQLDVDESEIAWNDLRVQSWAGEEKKENMNWMLAQAAKVMMEGQLQVSAPPCPSLFDVHPAKSANLAIGTENGASCEKGGQQARDDIAHRPEEE